MRKLMISALAPVLLTVFTVPSLAAVVYEQAYNGTLNAYASQNDPGANGSFAKVYDNFSLGAAASITDVHWTGAYFGGSAGTITKFLIEFWADSATGPSSLLYTADINGAAANETVVSGFVYSYDVVLASAFQAAAGTTYWLSIQPTMTFPPQWGWAESNVGDNLSYQSFFGTIRPLETDMAFGLTSTTPSDVPEPGGLALAGLALLGLFAASRAKRGA